ncbi:MAG: sodium/proline symporter [Planctomycetota bacterium]
MDYATTVLVTLIVYKLLLVGIGVAAQRFNRDEQDYLLGGRGLGPVVASLSAAASSSSAWSLIGVAYASYTSGIAALWIFPACVGGFAFNWYVLAPLLRRTSLAQGSLTATEVLALDADGRRRPAVAWLATVLILFSFLTYVAAQYQAAGIAFEANFGTPRVTSILLGAAIILVYTLLGGFWAVSLTDTLQGLLMAFVAVLLPVVALVACGGPAGLHAGLAALPDGDALLSLSRGGGLPVGLGLAMGLLGIGFGYPGQPHVVNRFMALRDERALVVGRRITLVWAVAIYAGMLLLGLCARVLYPTIDNAETLLFEAARELLHPVLAGVVVAALLSATMSTADSQLLVAASAVSHDLARERREAVAGMRLARLVVVVVSVLAAGSAFLWEETIFKKVLFAWSALGAAFGPLLLVRCLRGPITLGGTLAAMASGAGLAVLAYALRTGPLQAELADWGGGLERVLPFVVALAIAWCSVERRPAQTIGTGPSPAQPG